MTKDPDRESRVIAWLFVVGVPLLLGGADFLRDRGIARFHDNQTVQGPLRLEAGRQWAEGRIPLWNPYKRAGAPLLADVSGALYPPNWSFVWADEANRHRFLDAIAVVHQVGSGVAMYLLLVTLGLRREAAALGSLVYSTNGFAVFGAARWIDLHNAYAWAPLVLWSLERAREPGRLWRASGLGAGAYALQILCGYPEYAFYTALLAAGFAFAGVVAQPARWKPQLGALAIVGVGGALLAAPQLLPTLEAVALGQRAAVVPLAQFVAFALAPSDLLGLLVGVGPTGSGAWPETSLALSNGALFVGALPVALAAAALGRPERGSFYALGVLVVAVVLALGPHSPFGAVGHHVPGLNAFRSPIKHVFEVVFATSMLAAFGADRLLRGKPSARLVVVIACGAAFAVCVYVGASLEVAGGWWMAAAALAAGAITWFASGRVAVLSALCIAAAALAVGRSSALERAREEPPLPPVSTALREALRATPGARVLVLRDRVRRSPLAGDLATAAQIRSTGGAGPYLWEPLADALRMDEIGFVGDPRVLLDGPTLDRLAVTHIASPVGPLGRVHWARRLLGLGRIQRFEDFVLVERPGTASFARLESGAVGVVTLESLEPGDVWLSAEVRGDAPHPLIVAQAAWPGWRAHVDGVRAPLERDGLVQRVSLAPGTHRVRLSYRPTSFTLGAVLGVSTLVALAAMRLVEGRRRVT